MIDISPEAVLDLLHNHKKANGIEYFSDCPFCGKEKHFFIELKHPFLYSCKKCLEEGNVFTLLKHLGVRPDYIKESIDITKHIKMLGEEETEDEIQEIIEPTEEKSLPRGFKRVYFSKYLKGRHFIDRNYKDYKIGICVGNKKYEHYVIFSVEEDGVCKGFVGRCVLKKEEYERKGLKRYENSYKTKFSKLLWGSDKISKNTKTVILFEGITDCIRLINLLCLYDQEEVICCCTFGKKLSANQIHRLKSLGVKNILLFHDTDAIIESKKHALELSVNFNNVLVTFMRNGKDPSSSEDDEIYDALERVESWDCFNYNRVPVIK